jgi:spore coat polysaccharide biosynthesis predicted glycosyltransferase SpsG
LTKVQTFWFGCQSNSKVGLGHVSRCVSLAEEIQSREGIACFGHLSNLDSRGVQMLSLSALKSECVCNLMPSAVIYDSYDLEFIQNDFLDPQSKVVLLVDEVSLPFSADAYIEASPIKTWQPFNKFAPVFKFDANPILRTAFDSPLGARSSSGPFDVIINLGAAKDFQLILDDLLPQIRRRKIFNREISILSGSNSIAEIVKANEISGLNFIEGTCNLKDLMGPNAFVISAAGVTAWELISLGVPGFIIGVVDNQVEQLQYFNKLGLRNGVLFENDSDFSSQISSLLDNMSFDDVSQKARKTLKNGRVETVNWILSEVLNVPNRRI